MAERVARAAGVLLLDRFGTPARGVATKETGTDMVSDADRDAEALILGMIRDRRPFDGVLGEESGERPGSSGLLWIVDPLDGTTNFLYGIPQWCVSVAVEDVDGGVAGVVYDPNRDELFAATRGGGATLNGTAIRASLLTDVSTALVATGYAYHPEERLRWGRVTTSMLPRVRDLRRGGSAALDLAWCAAGRVDVYAEIPCRRWDRAAGALIAAEAGCTVGMLPALGPSGEGVLAAPPALFEPMAGILRDAGIDC